MKNGLGKRYIGRLPPISLAPHSRSTIRLVTGFLEKVYQRAMQVELIKRGSQAELEVPIKVLYKSALVGEYYADLLVDGSVMVEIKVAKCYNREDETQLLNELKATAVKVGMLVNFGREHVQYKRMIL